MTGPIVGACGCKTGSVLPSLGPEVVPRFVTRREPAGRLSGAAARVLSQRGRHPTCFPYRCHSKAGTPFLTTVRYPFPFQCKESTPVRLYLHSAVARLQPKFAARYHLKVTTPSAMATLLTEETAAKSSHQGPTTTVYEKGLQVGTDINRITKIETFRVRPRWLFVRVETSRVG